MALTDCGGLPLIFNSFWSFEIVVFPCHDDCLSAPNAIYVMGVEHQRLAQPAKNKTRHAQFVSTANKPISNSPTTVGQHQQKVDPTPSHH